MFDLITGQTRHIPSKPGVPLLISMSTQLALVTSAMLPVLFFTGALPDVPTVIAFVAEAPAPPPPPPPPAPPAARAATAPQPTTPSAPGAAPVEAPADIQPERPNTGIEIGVTGGVEGGIPGGVVVGVVGALAIGAFGPTLEASVGASEEGGGLRFGGPFGQGVVESTVTEVALDAPVSGSLVVWAVALAVLGGLVAGAVGSLRASRLRPADALRHID